MKKQKILGTIQGLSGLLAIGAMRIWAPVCNETLELADGRQVPMGCHYADKAGMVLAIMIVLVSVLIIMSNTNSKSLFIVNLALGIFMILIFTTIIGVCMRSQLTKYWIIGCGLAVILASLLSFYNSKSQLPNE